ncbi:hypothetical protein H0O02_01910 [Candidatus Micrarchaeota archaeon]|nr:hypothetical protein [Candidatus Micrarchaeota archaeon]
MEISKEDILKKLPLEIIIILGTLAVYLIAKSVLDPQDKNAGLVLLFLSALVVFELVYFVWKEIKEGVSRHGWKHEIVDTLIAIVVAVLLWAGASVILNTTTPVSAVVSCSMLPNLERGDFIIVQGAGIDAYEIEMSGEEMQSLSEDTTVTAGGQNFILPMPLYAYCNCHRTEPLCVQFADNPESVIEKTGPFIYHYGACTVDFRNGVGGYGKCLEYVEFRGEKYYQNLSHDVIVYAPPAGDLFAGVGDIVHRTFFKINADGKTYYLTKGDNNPIFDIQMADASCRNPDIRNHPIPQENVRGKVIGRVPYLGYLKLFIVGQWNEDEQCGWQIDYTTVR